MWRNLGISGVHLKDFHFCACDGLQCLHAGHEGLLTNVPPVLEIQGSFLFSYQTRAFGEAEETKWLLVRLCLGCRPHSHSRKRTPADSGDGVLSLKTISVGYHLQNILMSAPRLCFCGERPTL